MRVRQWLNGARRLLSGNLFSLLLFAAVMVIFLGGVRQAGAAREGEAKRIAEESLTRAVISCYAIEGRYPESYDYLKENYGVSIDESKYAVHYEVFASNIMPDISFVEK